MIGDEAYQRVVLRGCSRNSTFFPCILTEKVLVRVGRKVLIDLAEREGLIQANFKSGKRILDA